VQLDVPQCCWDRVGRLSGKWQQNDVALVTHIWLSRSILITSDPAEGVFVLLWTESQPHYTVSSCVQHWSVENHKVRVSCQNIASIYCQCHCLSITVALLLQAIYYHRSMLPTVKRTDKQKDAPFYKVGVGLITNPLSHFAIIFTVSFNDFCVENCSWSHSGCQTVWNTDVSQLYRELVSGTSSKHKLEFFCRYWRYSNNQWSNYEGARGGLAPWKIRWPPRNTWFERVQGGPLKGPLKAPWNHPSNSMIATYQYHSKHRWWYTVPGYMIDKPCSIFD